MLLSELLGARVHCAGAQIGYVIDVRLVVDRDAGPSARPGTPRIHGLVVSPRARASTLGYERSGVRSPWAIAAFERWTHRGSFLVLWEDVQTIGDARVGLRPQHHRYAATLRGNLTRGSDGDEREH